MAVAAKEKHKDPAMRGVLSKLKPGYTIQKGRGGHWKVVDAKTGKSVQREDGSPLTISDSASDRNAAKAVERELSKYKLLKGRVTAPARAQRNHTPKPELRRNVETMKRLGEERRDKTRALLTDMDKWMSKLGGWDARGRKADIAAILSHLNPKVFALPVNAQAMLTNFTKGDGVSDETRQTLHALNEMFQASEDVRGLYNDLIRQAKGISSAMGPVVLKKGQEWPYVVKLIEISELFPDYAYQRPVHEPFVRQLTLTFDERLVGVVDVSQRSNGAYAILDGLQRVTTMKAVGKTTCYCAVYEGMSQQDEAQFFFHKNKDRKGMSAFYGFRAKALAGDERALAIEKILKTHGFKFGPLTDQDTVIGAVRAVEDVYDWVSKVRPNCLPPTLQLINDCWRGRKGSTDTEIIRGTGRFFRVFGDDEIQWEHWKEALTALGPTLVIGRARDYSGATEQRGHGKSMAATLVEIHNTGLGSKDRLSLKRIAEEEKAAARSR